MRVGFVGRQYDPSYMGGDRILDDRTVGELSQMFTLRRLELPRDATSRTVMRTLVNCSHPALESYAQRTNIELIDDLATDCDALVISHEAVISPLLAANCSKPCLILLHNVLSLATGELGWRGHFRDGAERLEHRATERPRTRLMTLSRREQIALQVRESGKVEFAPPGYRSIATSVPHTLESRGLILNGSTEWGLKRRDARRFLTEFSALPQRPLLLGEDAIADDGRLRVAILTDRFQSGFKLKAADLMLRNVVLISFVDLSEDFPEACRPRLALRKIERCAQIPQALEDIKASRKQIAREIEALKVAAKNQMSWHNLALTVFRGLDTIIGL